MVVIILIGVVVILLISLVGYMYEVLVLKPKRIKKKLQSQGIKGPTPSSLLLGNIPEIIQIKAQLNISDLTTTPLSHDWTPHSFPHLKLWQKLYGRMFVYSTGSLQMISILDPNIIKEVSLNTNLDLGKPDYLSKDRGPLLGNGIVSSSGSFWTYQRKLIAPEFFPDKIKGMMEMMAEATTPMVKSWEDIIKNNGGLAEITVDEDLRNLSQDIISKAAFGSSYSKGKHIFSKIRTLQGIMAKNVIGVPGARYMPTKSNWQTRRLEKEINQMILRVVKDRMNAKQETDFLQKMVEGAKMCTNEDDPTMKNSDIEKLIVDNCKTMYFAGYETTSSSAAWTVMLLAAYPEWQARARDEVVQYCRDGIPDADDLRHLKVLTMIIQESLRLYPPVILSSRAAQQDTKLNGIQIPKGIDIQMIVPLLHHDQELWGQDVHEFKPERFANGITTACKSQFAYVPFGFGARICLGQNLAMVELKIVLSMILSKFRFSLSPSYKHSPAFRLITEPEHGVQILAQRV